MEIADSTATGATLEPVEVIIKEERKSSIRLDIVESPRGAIVLAGASRISV